MCEAPALTPAARTARAERAARAFPGLQTPFGLLRPRDTPAIDLLVDVGCCFAMRRPPMRQSSERGVSRRACWRV